MCNEASAAGDSECAGFLTACGVFATSIRRCFKECWASFTQRWQVEQSSRVMASCQVLPSSNITSPLKTPRLTLRHLLATCLWRVSHLDPFGPHLTNHPCTCRVAACCNVAPQHLFISYIQQRPWN